MEKLTLIGILVAVLLVVVVFQGTQLINMGNKLAGSLSTESSSSNIVVGTTGSASVGQSLPSQVGGC